MQVTRRAAGQYLALTTLAQGWAGAYYVVREGKTWTLTTADLAVIAERFATKRDAVAYLAMCEDRGFTPVTGEYLVYCPPVWQVTRPAPAWKVADVAGKAWDAGMVEYLPVGTGTYVRTDDAGTWVRDMVRAGARFLLWTLTDDAGESFPVEDYAPDYESALPDDARAELESDCEGFARIAWPYLSADAIGPQDAGRDFVAVSHGIDSGFDRAGHGHALSELARTFGFDVTAESDGRYYS